MKIPTASARQIAVLRIFDANHGRLTEAQLRTIDQRPCRGLGQRALIARTGADRFVMAPEARIILQSYEALDVSRRVAEMPLSSFFTQSNRRVHVMPQRAAPRRHAAAS